MNLSTCTKWILALLFLFAVAPAGAVELGEAGCHVLELPAVISEPGHYCLEKDWDLDLTGGGSAIEIRSGYVVVDFQGHQVRNLPGLKGDSSATFGVFAWDRSQIVVRNGMLAGFRDGISLGQNVDGPTRSRDHLIEGMRIYRCHRTGIHLVALLSVVRDNIIGDITGLEQKEAAGILIFGGGNRIFENVISVITGSSEGNRWGIRLEGGNRNLVVGNRLHATWNGIRFDYNSVYRDNFVLELPVGNTAFSGGTDAGGNFSN